MADFARLGQAMCIAGGYAPFDTLLAEKRDLASLVAIEASPIGAALLHFAMEEQGFSGTINELLAQLSTPLYRREGDV